MTSERQEAATEMLKEAGEKQEELAEEVRNEADEILPGEEMQAGESEKLLLNVTEIPEATESSKKHRVKLTEPESEDDIAKKAMTLIQSALTKLSEHSYSNTGGSVSVDLDRDTGKRIDIKR